MTRSATATSSPSPACGEAINKKDLPGLEACVAWSGIGEAMHQDPSEWVVLRKMSWRLISEELGVGLECPGYGVDSKAAKVGTSIDEEQLARLR